MSVVTRFAPSPTGYLHIGGARTALFNWLYAKHMGGQFLIRIEDTDKARNTPEAVEAIFGGLGWLGLDPDGDVVLQSRNAARHIEVAHQMVARGHAYYDPNDINEEGRRAVRIRGIKGEQTIEDLVQGTVTWPQDIDDFVILRSDGTPTYMLAVVVDDHDMGVTHVIRGDDHLNNAFRQLSIYQAMGWKAPVYGHIPLILDEQGKKLSKRSGNFVGVAEYADLGIMPDAMLNYLARLGWGHGNDEIFSMEQAIEWFDVKDVGRNPARLDSKKLASINGHYIRNTSPEDLAHKWVGPRLHEQGIDWPTDTLVGAMRALRERSADLNALTEGTKFLWETGPILRDQLIEGEDLHILTIAYYDHLPGIEWTHDGIMAALGNAAEALNVKLGKVVAPLRMALTGSKVSPPISDVMILLGKNTSLARIEDVIHG